MSGEVQQPNHPIEVRYPLTPLQQGMLYHSLCAAPGCGVDIEQLEGAFHERLDAGAFQEAWALVVQRHTVLRTAFRWADVDEPCQEVYCQVKLAWTLQDWRGLSPGNVERRLESFLQEDRAHGFDLGKPPLLRFALFRTDDSDYRFVWTFHHILLDGRSFPPLLREVFQQYEAQRRRTSIVLQPVPPFREHVEWLQKADWSKAAAFWQQTLRDFREPTPLPCRSPGAELELDGPIRGEHQGQLSETTTGRLRSLAADFGVTLNTVLQGAWALLVGRRGHENDVTFGVTRACRRTSVPGAPSMIGLFINTLPFRVSVNRSLSLRLFLQDVRSRWTALRLYEHTPLVHIQKWSGVPAGQPLFESLLVFENFHLDALLRAQGGDWLNRRFRLIEQTNYPLTLAAYLDRGLFLKLQTDRRRVRDADAREILDEVRDLLEEMVRHPEKRLSEFAVLGRVSEAPSREAFPAPSGQTETRGLERMSGRQPAGGFGPAATLHKIFETKAARTPEAIAVVSEGKQMTYREVNHLANRLAHHLREAGAGPEMLIGISLERSADWIISLLAVLKCGGAYVPMEPALPPERVSFLIDDTRLPMLITHRALAGRFSGYPTKTISADELLHVQVGTEEAQDEANLNGPLSPDNLAYVIYTSGSTGRPKGVQVTHRNVTRLFEATEPWFGFSPQDVWTLFHSCAFDFSVWEIWGALLYGGRVVVVPHAVSRSPSEFCEFLAEHQVTILNQTPSAFYQLIQAESDGALPIDAPPLRLVIFGGEALQFQSLAPWFRRHGDRAPQLVNMFGITETTVHVTGRPLTRADAGPRSLIGRPIPDLSLHLLDPGQQPVPIGVPGEIYVGGPGVARGYLNRPDLTAERFVPDLFGKIPGQRLYRSGDLARRLAGGDLEYLGRADDQIKIRGHRIEPGEIESVLMRHPSIQEARVWAEGDRPSTKHLAAYLVARGSPPNASELQMFLRRQLPEYMIPSKFVAIDRFPLTANGKVDRHALAASQASVLESGHAHQPPRTELERTIAAVWQKVLGLPKVGLDENFYDLGGNSILLIQLYSKLRAALQKEFLLTVLFQYPTVRLLSRYLSEAPATEPNFQRIQQRAQRHAQALASRQSGAAEIQR